MSAARFTIEAPQLGPPLGRFASLTAVEGLAHGVSTLAGPDFSAPADSREFDAAARELAGAIGLKTAAWMRQVHGNRVLLATGGGPAGEGDALVTATSGLALLGRSADCPLILVAGSGENPVCGVAHASWRGTVLGVSARMVEAMSDRLGAEPARLLAAVCPSAGPCCYEVGPEVREEALARLGGGAEACFFRREGRLVFDLWRANARQLEQAGIPAGNIQLAGLCTICRGDLFPSHRRDADRAGRFAAALGWREIP